MKKCLVIFFLFAIVPFLVQADEGATATTTATTTSEAVATSTVASSTELISVFPSIIDEQIHIKDIGKYDVLIKNNTNHKADIYPVVNNVLIEDGRQEFVTMSGEERGKSLANWISFKRGAISLMPGEEVTVPLKIQAALTVQPGKYYAMISLPEGANRVEAENSIKTIACAQIMISIEIVEDTIEKAKLQEFSTNKGMFFSLPVKFSVKIDNFGNKKIDPHGSIFVYNRRGEEVVSLGIGSGDIGVQPGGSSSLEKAITGNIDAGKYKAKLVLEYGESGTRDLQDTVYFWFLPWGMLLGFLAVFIVLIILSTFFLYKKTYVIKKEEV